MIHDFGTTVLVRWSGPLAFIAVVLIAISACADRTDGGMATQETRRLLPADRSVAVTYVAMGDSTVSGVGATSSDRNYVNRLFGRLRDVYPAATATNLGVPAATSEDVLQFQLPAVLERQPHLVTISVGPNDITTGLDDRDFDQNVEAIFRTLERETDAVIVVSLLPDLALAPIFSEDARDEFGRKTFQFNKVLEHRGKEHGVVLVDLYTASQREGTDTALIGEDGYHPSDEGYALWAALMWEGIETRIPR